MQLEARNSAHLMELSGDQADAASYICELTRSLSKLAFNERLFFLAELLQIVGDAAWDCSANRRTLMTTMQAISTAKQAERYELGSPRT